MSNTKMTIFTPTFNREKELLNAYNSIVSQGYSNVTWLVVDDGSNDNTSDQINLWIKENLVSIKYIKQENMGRYAAYNNAIEHFTGELIVFLDSDDILAPNALKNISNCWREITTPCCGIIAYKSDIITKNIVGTEFPKNLQYEKNYILYDKYKLTGDKCQIFSTEIISKYKYKIFDGEKLTSDSIIFNKANEKYPMKILPSTLQYVEYMENGLSNNLKLNQYKSPNGMLEHYKSVLYFEKYNIKNIIKHVIGYLSFSFFLNKKISVIFHDSPKKLLTWILWVPSYIYYLLKMRKYKERIK